ncbi:MAG: uncharacterized protein QG610_1518, partial [Euryarchaeota archaeon]|nr:uncharacterized protein [Euryarchaeota archaeon]
MPEPKKEPVKEPARTPIKEYFQLKETIVTISACDQAHIE